MELGADIEVEEVEFTDKEKKLQDQTLQKLGKFVNVKTTLFDKKKVAEDKGFPELSAFPPPSTFAGVRRAW